VARRSRTEAEARARRALEELGLGHRLDAYPEMLSGGQRQRVAIARALAMEPTVLLYDEPTSALDPSLRREVVETLRRVRSLGMTQVVVTHDVQLARASEVVLVLDHGLLVEHGPPEQVLDAPRHDATRRLLAQAR
jgi:ABC-type polar amino acid transport system ATPase subunit